jgi:uncharacterized protein (DUF433 family)
MSHKLGLEGLVVAQLRSEKCMKYISSTPDIMGGAPVIAGTRVPIEVILYYLKDGYTLDELQEMYNWVDRQTLEGAIDEAISYIGKALNAQKVS